jgi:hypothetical protein
MINCFDVSHFLLKLGVSGGAANGQELAKQVLLGLVQFRSKVG